PDRDGGRFWLTEQDRVNHGVFASKAYFSSIGGRAARASPRSRGVDGFAILMEPISEGLQPAQLNGRNRSVGLGSNIKKQVAILAHDIHQEIDQVFRGNRFGFAF